jgi:hypothetical protein
MNCSTIKFQTSSCNNFIHWIPATLSLTIFWHNAKVSSFEDTNESRPHLPVCRKSCRSVADETRDQAANRVMFCGSASLQCRRDCDCCLSVHFCSVLTNCESISSFSWDPKAKTQHASYNRRILSIVSSLKCSQHPAVRVFNFKELKCHLKTPVHKNVYFIERTAWSDTKPTTWEVRPGR